MNERLLLRLALLFALIGAIDALPLSSNTSEIPVTLSGCQVCVESGDCLHAYLDGPGQFCGNWLDRASQRQRCCCPREATCEVSNFACKCRNSKAKRPTALVASSSSSRASWGTIFGSVALLFGASSIIWCLCPCCRANRYAALSQQAMTPVAVQAPMYANVYGPGYGHGPGYSNGGMGAGSSAMLGGVAGMFGGILVGQALSDAGGHHGENYTVDNGSDDFGGDF